MAGDWAAYRGEEYLDFSAVETFCRSLAASHPDWIGLEEVGESRMGRPMLLLSISRSDGEVGRKPAFWLDGGTHAAEFAGVMATLYAMSRWIEAILEDQAGYRDWFTGRAAYVMPCISPDGFQAMCDGAPFLRSSLRTPRPGAVRSGLDPCDIDGDGVVRSMRWKHPAGAFVADSEVPLFMRPRMLADDADDAYFLCQEGEFIHWDGHSWHGAQLAHGIDMNRNFPGNWQPFEMNGMDSGAYALSEPESRAVVDAFAARPFIGAALTNHTYTGCLLTQPYQKHPSLTKSDIDLLEQLARSAVQGTDYKVYRVNPDFTYDPDNPIVGVWSDTMATVFGVPAYTLELWDPYREAGLEDIDPMQVFMRPEPEQMKQFIAHFSSADHAVAPWREFDHPQLGPVEIGGIDYLHTIRNPPVSLLARECESAFSVAEHLRRALPEVRAELHISDFEALSSVDLCLQNLGFLPTSATALGATLSAAPKFSVRIDCGAGIQLVNGPAELEIDHLDGWGQAQVGAGRNSLYAGLPERGHLGLVRWLVKGEGQITVSWCAGRAGTGSLTETL